MRFNRLPYSLLGSWLAFFLLTGFLETTSGLNKKGNEHFREKRYESALESYRKAQIRDPDRPEIRYNVGTSLYQLEQFREAQSQLEQALTNAETNEFKAQAWYNYGNAQYRLGQFDQAIEAYRTTLDLNPKDEDAKFNLELIQKKKAMFEKKQDKRDQQKKDKTRPRQNQNQQSEGGKGQDQQTQSQGQRDQQKPRPEGDEEQDQQPQDTKGTKGETPKEPQELPGEQAQPQQKGDERPEPMRPAQEGLEKDQKEGEGEQPRPLLQGQMSKSDAMRILDALRETEQQLQLLRQPQRRSDSQPLKDW